MPNGIPPSAQVSYPILLALCLVFLALSNVQAPFRDLQFHLRKTTNPLCVDIPNSYHNKRLQSEKGEGKEKKPNNALQTQSIKP